MSPFSLPGLLTAAAAALLLFPVDLVAQPPRGRPLLESPIASGAEVARPRPGDDVTPRRSRTATARLDALADDRGIGPETLLLNLFDDTEFLAERTTSARGGDGRLVWRGRLHSVTGEVTLVARGSTIAATIFAEGRAFEVRSTGQGAHEVRELDPAAFPTDDPPLSAPGDSPGGMAGDTGVPPADGGDRIDVLVVYTTAARARAGGLTGILNLIDLAVANANAAYANSLVSAQLRLVGTAEVSYAESSDILTDLTRLRSTDDGHLDGVHGLRDQYGADLVSLVGTGYSSACGIGYLLGSPSSASPSYGFNVVRDSCAAGNLSFAHEIGHNQGLHHDPANASGSPAYSYAYGYQDPGGAFRTVMSYGAAVRVAYLSSAEVTYAGRPTGVANAQDNARALRGTAAVVAGYRPEAGGNSCSFTVNPTSLSFAADGGSSPIVIGTASSCAWTVSGGASWLTFGSTSGSGPTSLTVTASRNLGALRSATIAAAGRSVTITQGAAPPPAAPRNLRIVN